MRNQAPSINVYLSDADKFDINGFELSSFQLSAEDLQLDEENITVGIISKLPPWKILLLRCHLDDRNAIDHFNWWLSFDRTPNFDDFKEKVFKLPSLIKRLFLLDKLGLEAAIAFAQTYDALAKLNLKKLDLRDVTLKDLDLHGLDFSGSNFEGASIVNCNLEGAKFGLTQCKNTQFTLCNMVGLDFSGSSLTAAIIKECNLSQAIFSSTHCNHTQFIACIMIGVDCSNNVELESVIFDKCDITDGTFDSINTGHLLHRDPEEKSDFNHVDLVRGPSKFYNCDLTRTSFISANCTRFLFKGGKLLLQETNFNKTILRGAEFIDVVIKNVKAAEMICDAATLVCCKDTGKQREFVEEFEKRHKDNLDRSSLAVFRKVGSKLLGHCNVLADLKTFAYDAERLFYIKNHIAKDPDSRTAQVYEGIEKEFNVSEEKENYLPGCNNGGGN